MQRFIPAVELYKILNLAVQGLAAQRRTILRLFDEEMKIGGYIYPQNRPIAGADVSLPSKI